MLVAKARPKSVRSEAGADCYTAAMLDPTIRRRGRLFACAALLPLLLWLALPPTLSARPPAATVLVNEAVYAFAESMTFTLEARADAGIEDVVLRFQVDEEDVRNRRIPAFEPGSKVRAEHREPLPRGALHPTAEVHWWWTIVDRDGVETVTARRSLRYVDEQLDWEVLDGNGVRVWHHGSSQEQAREWSAMAGRALDGLEAMVGLRVDRPIEVIAYQRQSDLRRALSNRGATYESRLATLGARVADDTVVLDVGSSAGDLEEVVFHELSHIVLHLHLGAEWVRVPAWLDEGLAMYAEGELSSVERRVLDRAIAGDSILSVRSLSAFPGDAELVSLAYAQSQDLVAFLVEEHPPERFRGLLDRLVDGETTFDEALAAEYDYDALTMYQAYRAARGLEAAVLPEAGEPVPVAREEDASLPLCAGWLGLLLLALAVSPRFGTTSAAGTPRGVPAAGADTS